MAHYPRVTHPCATKPNKYYYISDPVRLACLKHAASVRSEPESNSPVKKFLNFFSREKSSNSLQLKPILDNLSFYKKPKFLTQLRFHSWDPTSQSSYLVFKERRFRSNDF